MNKYRIEYYIKGKWKLYGDYYNTDLIVYNQDIMRLIGNGYTLKLYRVN